MTTPAGKGQPSAPPGPPQRRARLHLFRLGQASVEVPFGVLPLLALLGWLLATSLLPTMEGATTHSPLLYAIMGAIGAIALLACALAHDLAHAAVAQGLGRPVQRVILFHHGSPAEAAQEAETPWQEVAMALSGPVATFTLAGVAGLLGWMTALGPPAGPVLRFLAIANVLLGLSSLLPGLPLDGGRLVRAIGWAVTGSPVAGARWAFVVARGFAVACLPTSCVLALLAQSLVPLLWGILLGAALWLQAGLSWRATRVRTSLAGLVALDALEPAPPALSRVVSVAEALTALAESVGGTPPAPVHLVDYSGRLGGIVTLAALQSVAEEERAHTPVGQVTIRLQHAHVLEPRTGLLAALARIRAAGLPLLPVIANGEVLGIVTRRGLERLINGVAPPRPAARPAPG